VARLRRVDCSGTTAITTDSPSDGALDGLGEAVDLGQPSFQGAVEEAVLDLLEEERTSAIAKVA
jgi:hypothetical protein